MKRILFTLLFTLSCFFLANAQNTKIGPVEQRLTDSLCNSVSRLDITKITTRDEAVAAYTECVMKNADLLPALANEKGIEMTDQPAMRALGIKLATNLVAQKCEAFLKLSTKMANKETQEQIDATTGTFKRIDNKGFNYLVVTVDGSEKQFLWLEQFAGSEKFMGNLAPVIGKRIRITSKEIEVYLPAAKGYFKVKEITAIEFL